MVGVQMGKKDPINVLPSDFDLRETLDRATASIEEKFLVGCLDQYARAEAVHHRRRVSCAKQSYAYFLAACGARNNTQ
jgi:hypothetical protein